MDKWQARAHILQALTELQQLEWGLKEHPELENSIGASGVKTAVATACRGLSKWAQEAGVYSGPGPTDKK